MDRIDSNSGIEILRNHFSRFVRTRPRLKSPLLATLGKLTECGFRGVIFGGALRDLMVHGPATEPRDVDVVVDGVSIEELSELFKDVLVRKTRFGGLHLSVKGWMVDVWPLSQTWAFKESAIRGRDFEALTRTTFLNIEAVTIELAVRHGRRQVHANGFFEAVKTRTLDINLEENPFPELAAVRALITAARLRYNLSKRLANYIVHHANVIPLEKFVDVQIGHYGCVKCDIDAIHGWVNSIKTQIQTQSIARIPIGHPTQLLLPLWEKDKRASLDILPALTCVPQMAPSTSLGISARASDDA